LSRLTPTQRRQRMIDSLKKQNLSIDNIEEEYCHAIYIIEKELGHYIDDEYPVIKFLQELENYHWYSKEEKKQMDGL